MSEQPRSRRNLRLVEAALAGVLALPGLAACSSHNAAYNQYANCVNASGQVVPSYYCDDSRYYGGGGSFFIFMGPSLYSPGYLVPYSNRGSFINPRDSYARSRAGLPSTGRVGGTSVRSGGIGRGSSSGSGGGFSSGGGSGYHSSSGS